jgi:hypothetical protein
MRGYESENFTTYLNGVPVNDLEDGTTPWSQWGGLNNVFYNRENSLGLQPTTFTYGGVGGGYNFDARASKQRKQLQVSYSNTDRNYNHRLMVTYSTGIMKSGWAVSVAVSRRWAKEGYVPGTFYDGYSYFLSAEKKFNNAHSLALTLIGSPTRSGGSAAATKEMYDLAGSNYYNPDWGWQNGVKRNAKVANTHQPLIILTHEWKINNNSNLTTAAGFSFGTKERTSIDWNNAANPAPDYYRNLPSYIEDSTLQTLAQKEFRENENMRQVNWNSFYEANALSVDSVKNANGIAGNTVIGKRGRYIVENRIQNIKKFNFATTYNNTLTDHIGVTAGLLYQYEHAENYKKVDDLLGADFYVDVNQFAERDFPDSNSVAQNDLNHPNRILHEGDKFGYDYVINIHHAQAWAQSVFKYNKVDFFVAANLSYTAYWRDGKYRNGLFADDSYGKSAVKNFVNGGIKAGVTYKIDGRNYLYANGGYENRAPYFENAFVSARTRNDYAYNLKSENIYSAEAGYILRLPNVRIKADMFFTQFNDATQTITFFDDDVRTFVNYTLTGINKRHWGGELGIDAKLYKGFGASAAVSMGRYTYTDRPSATITQDNSNQVLTQNETVYLKNFNIGGTPQLASTFGLNYHAPQFWFVSVNFNYYDWMWVTVNPARRTMNGIDLVDPSAQNWQNIVNQERLKGQFTMDIHAGYSWLLNNQFKNLKKKYYLVFNAGVTNLTNNKNFITNGYEQLRFDYKFKNTEKFPTKYYYGYGATYFVSLTFRMN